MGALHPRLARKLGRGFVGVCPSTFFSVFLTRQNLCCAPRFPHLQQALTRKFERFADLGLFHSGSAETKNPAASLQDCQAVCPEFLAAVLESMNPMEQAEVFKPQLLALSNTLARVTVDNAKATQATSTMDFLLELPQARQVYSSMLQAETQQMTTMPSHFSGGHGLGKFFSCAPPVPGPRGGDSTLAPGFLSSEPVVLSPRDAEAQARVWMMNMKTLRFTYKQQLHRLMKDKVNVEAVLAWVARVFENNKGRASSSNVRLDPRQQAQFAPPNLLLNLTVAMLQFCEPFARVNAKAHQDFARLDYRWFLTGHRADVRQEPKVATGNSSSSAVHNASGSGFEMDVDEAGELADAIRLSLGGTLDQDQEVDADAEIGLPEEYHFVTECFGLTLRAVHVGLVPRLKEFVAFQRDFQKFVQTQTEQGKSAADLQGNKQFYSCQQQMMHFQATLCDEHLLQLVASFCNLVAAWLMRLAAQSTATSIFSRLPEHVLKDLGVLVLHVAQWSPDILATVSDVQELISGIVFFIDPPKGLVHSPIVRQSFVDVITAFSQRQGQGSQRLQDMVYSNPSCQDLLVRSLLHLYVDVGYVEGATEVFDKNAARATITGVITDLWSWPKFRLAMYAVAEKDPIFPDFALAVLSDATFLFNDATGRLNDVKIIQEQLAADTLPPREREAQEQSLRHVERTAKGFLRMANKCVSALRHTYSADAMMRTFFLKPPVASRVAQTAYNFLDRLCGTRIRELKVKNPEKYGWDPKALLCDVGYMSANFAQHPFFVPALLAIVEDTSLLGRAHRLLQSKCFVGPEVIQVFESLVAQVQQDGVGYGPITEDVVSQALEHMSTSDAEEVSLDPIAKPYFDRLFALACNEARFYDGAAHPDNDSDDDDDDDEFNDEGDGEEGAGITYSTHHFHQNISKSTGMNRAKMTRLLQELKSLTPDEAKRICALPLSPGAAVFLRHDSKRLDTQKVLITGPIGTPYFGGLFLFDIFIPDSYPDMPPLVNLETTGGNQFRFNPNLYSCGKVCLSLLGTWHGGAKTEGWNKDTSTLLQVSVFDDHFILTAY